MCGFPHVQTMVLSCTTSPVFLLQGNGSFKKNSLRSEQVNPAMF
jgi:hypothetical protein